MPWIIHEFAWDGKVMNECALFGYFNFAKQLYFKLLLVKFRAGCILLAGCCIHFILLPD